MSNVRFIPKGRAPLSAELIRTKYKNVPLLHWCEVCGMESFLTPEEGYKQGFDGPWLYGLGALSPRTCAHCSIIHTVWWRIAYEGVPFEALSERELHTLGRILSETE